MHYMRRPFLFVMTAMVLLLAAPVHAATFETAGWVPYWRYATGTTDALVHLDALSEVNPFVFTLKSDGTLVDSGPLATTTWQTLITAAQAKKVRVIPTIMSGNGAFMHSQLSNATRRRALEDRIAAMVNDGGYDGVDIDFEAKKAETKKYFSTFLKGLAQRLGPKKWLICTVEARTPPADAFAEVPVKLEYSNDYKAIGKYCDRVRIMAYDQQSADLSLNFEHLGYLYAPVADPAWVEKALRLAMKEIPKNKLVLGIPTYGYEYDVVGDPEHGYTYDILWTFNQRYAIELATENNIMPQRQSTGEMAFSYHAPSDLVTTPSGATVSATSGELVRAPTTVASTFRYVVWEDASAIQSKIALAQRLGIRGVAVFKIDGGEDMGMWQYIAAAKK